MPHMSDVGPRDGKFIFLMEISGKVFAYSSHVNTLVVWYSDGPGDPCFPLVKVSFECEVEDGLEKNFIMERLRQHKSKAQPKPLDADRQLEARV